VAPCDLQALWYAEALIKDIWGLFALVEGEVGTCTNSSWGSGTNDVLASLGVGGLGRTTTLHSQSIVGFHSLSQLWPNTSS